MSLSRVPLLTTLARFSYAAEDLKSVCFKEDDLRKKKNGAFILLILLASPAHCLDSGFSLNKVKLFPNIHTLTA